MFPSLIMRFSDLVDMFCQQCEQTEAGTGCTTIGVCGKTPVVAGLQDLLVDNVKGISMWLHRARQVSLHRITSLAYVL
jgi:hydroxylamine reductase (hybrid-cluster protein)